ncbi:glycosyltransferase [Microlunatus elymi]|uniref:Glycosyltransferase n=1 Tax=Microlunatus elymi TaxID=2596828 RepID=A0A516PXJ6_9ACTN|nr:glycosyltransferase [Microlunatus elymi]QDP95886.1 glycosyltransferase [Microlunatus elymi]
MDRPQVVMFARTISRRVAGGSRAVLQRANLYAAEGYPVTLVISGMASDSEIAALRSAGGLHPQVAVRFVWLDAPGWEHQLAGADHELVDLPRLDERTPGTVRSVLVPGRDPVRARVVRIEVDGRLRSEEVLDTDGGAIRSFRLYDGDGSCTQLWRFVDGKVAMVDDLADGVPTIRRFFIDGRYCWLTADVSGSAGTGRAVYADGTISDYASVIADWLDREYADSPQLIVFADGENVWQRVVRCMRHPAVRGVSVLHNSHLDAPYDSTAPTKPDWEPYFTDQRNVRVLVCLTERQRIDLERRYPGLPLAVVHHQVPPTSVDHRGRRSRRMIFLGRLAEQKRLEHLVEVIDRVRRAVPEVVLDVYGSGPAEPDFRSRLEECGLIDRVNFAGFTQDALAAFAGARVAVMTSRYEGLPLTLTEAMSVGTVWVAYDLNYGPAEVIRDHVDGFLVPPGDLDRFAASVVRLLTDDDLAARMSRAAREVSGRFSRERYRREWLQVLARAIEPIEEPTTDRVPDVVPVS